MSALNNIQAFSGQNVLKSEKMLLLAYGLLFLNNEKNADPLNDYKRLPYGLQLLNRNQNQT